MKKSKNLFVLISILAAIATFLAIWRLFLVKPQEKTQVIPKSPTPIITSIPTEIRGRSEPGFYEKVKDETETNFPLLNLLPHEETNWTLDYIRPLHLEATAKKGNVESIKLEVSNWIRANGVDPQSHQIDWKIAP